MVKKKQACLTISPHFKMSSDPSGNCNYSLKANKMIYYNLENVIILSSSKPLI